MNGKWKETKGFLFETGAVCLYVVLLFLIAKLMVG